MLTFTQAPDDRCDLGKQTFRYSLLPHTGSLQDAGVVSLLKLKSHLSLSCRQQNRLRELKILILVSLLHVVVVMHNRSRRACA